MDSRYGCINPRPYENPWNIGKPRLIDPFTRPRPYDPFPRPRPSDPFERTDQWW